jgi:hypothetical protein
MLVFLALALFVGAPLVATGIAGPQVFDVLFSFLLLSGVIAVSRRRPLTIAVSALTLTTLAVKWASYSGTAIGLWGNIFPILCLLVLTAFVLEQVFSEGPVTGYRIQGAVAVYLLLGLIWTQAYELLYRIRPDAFHFSQAEPNLTHGLAYYSFVTLTTVGYGDITPVHPVARSLAMAEALVGQLYPAILIGRLVSLQISAREGR